MADLQLERALRRKGYRIVAGIDEAGRGPLAGPVMAGAVVLPRNFSHPYLTDSKKLSHAQREKVYAELVAEPDVMLASARVESDEIDKINILQATYQAMKRAFEALPLVPDVALIDGKPVQHFPAEYQAIIKGDSISFSIAAASIVAKVERDRIMVEYAEIYPEYGFERHKGYGTRVHCDALKKWGACPIHRQSFAPVAAVL